MMYLSLQNYGLKRKLSNYLAPSGCRTRSDYKIPLPFVYPQDSLVKELVLERKALEKKDDGQQRQKESSLKSNAMFTKAKKKKVTSSKRKPTTNKNKELGRAISLNIIYEEPSQIQQSSVKESTDGNNSNAVIPELKHAKESKVNDVEAKAPVTTQLEKDSITYINKSEIRISANTKIKETFLFRYKVNDFVKSQQITSSMCCISHFNFLQMTHVVCSCSKSTPSPKLNVFKYKNKEKGKK